MTTKIKIAFLLIVILAAVLRFYKLDTIPPSLNWDEAAAGYNAYTIANWGRDEWGQVFPSVFTSFEDDKHPVHIYITAIFIKLFGLSDFTTRLPGAVIGVLSVVVIFYLAQILFKNNPVALFSALFMAFSPYHLQFSRGLWEVNFALFFFMLGLLMFYLALEKRAWLINISFFSFGLSTISYHSSKLIVPAIILLLILFHFKDLKKLSLYFYTSMIILTVFIGLFFLEPRLLGTARAKQTQFEQISLLGWGEITLKQYLSHFTMEYLFISGDQSPRNSVKIYGEFYKIDALFILIGFLYLLKLKSKVSLVILAWLLLAPLPASLVKGAPSAARAMFMMGSFQLLAALGAAGIVNLFNRKIKGAILVIILIIFGLQVYSYLNFYFSKYPKRDPYDWQYGMKQVVEFVKTHPEYDQIYVTDIRSQPYIFFLYYLETPLPQFLSTVIYTRDTENRKTNLVSTFDKYYFGGWDPIESTPEPRVLYVLSPSQYDGLRHRADFSVKKKIYHPDGGDAFFLISAK